MLIRTRLSTVIFSLFFVGGKTKDGKTRTFQSHNFLFIFVGIHSPYYSNNMKVNYLTVFVRTIFLIRPELQEPR